MAIRASKSYRDTFRTSWPVHKRVLAAVRVELAAFAFSRRLSLEQQGR